MRNPSKRKAIIRQMVKVIRDEDLTYQEFIDICRDARNTADLEKPPGRTPVTLPPESDFQKFFAASENLDSKQRLMVRIFRVTGLRNSEVAKLLREDVWLPERKFFVRDGKGGVAKEVIFPVYLKDTLEFYMNSLPKNQPHLFDNGMGKRYTDRGIRALFDRVNSVAGTDIHPHLMRTRIATRLAEQGLATEDIQLLLQHKSIQSTEQYIKRAPGSIRGKYEELINQI